jgi:cbb3-type cytochrome oxidase subunit 3
MQGYDDSTPLQRKEGANSTSETGPKRFWRTAWFQVALALVLIVLLAMSITCCVLLGVFHSNLMFLCSYAEFMSLIVLQGIIAIFVCYHSYHIYKFFVPSKEEDDHENYGRIDEEDDQEEYEDDNDFENSKPMKVLFFIFKLLALLISLLAFAALVTLTITTITIQQLSFPQVNGTIKLLGLNNKATVQREANGMIHIKASNNHDLFFAQGVVTAQERMWQLEFHRRLASGTLSEILGAEALTTDKWSRTVGFYRAANATMSELPSDVVALVQAFCDGINAYIATGQHLAPEFGQIILDTKPQPWEPIDVVAFSKAVAWGLGLNAEVEVLRYKLLQQGISMDRVNQLYPLYPDDGPTVLSAKDLNINVTQKEIDELNKKFTNDSGAYIPLKQQFADFSTPYQSVSSLLNHFIGTHRASNNWVSLHIHFYNSL